MFYLYRQRVQTYAPPSASAMPCFRASEILAIPPLAPGPGCGAEGRQGPERLSQYARCTGSLCLPPQGAFQGRDEWCSAVSLPCGTFFRTFGLSRTSCSQLLYEEKGTVSRSWVSG